MKGHIIYVDSRVGWVGISDDSGDITIAEILGNYDLEIGDIIIGNLHSLGDEIFYNQSKAEKMSVFIEHVHLTRGEAIWIIQNRLL